MSCRHLIVGVLLTALALCFSSAITAQEREQATQTSTTDGSKTTTTPTGFPTGTKCTKTGTYTAENKFIKIVIFVAEGEEFPLFADGSATTWYALTPSTKSTFEAVKASSTDPK